MLHRFIILKGISAQALTLTFKEIVNLSNREKWEKFFVEKSEEVPTYIIWAGFRRTLLWWGNCSTKLCLSLGSFNQRPLTVYSDRLSINYPPISDVFYNIYYFFLHYTNDSTLTLLRNSSITKYFFSFL